MKYSTCGYLEFDGSYLMLLRNAKQNDVNSGKWIGVGGKFEPNETPRQCMVREIREETGIVLQQEAVLFRGIVYFHYAHEEDEKIWIYSAYCNNDHFDPCDEGELHWIKKEEILNLSLWQGDRIFLDKLLKDDETPFCLDLFYDDEGNLIRHKQREKNMNKPVIIGIAGGSASGKTTISVKLKEAFADEKKVLIIRQDDYYKDQSEKTMEERVKTNYDHPFAFDNDLLIEQIHALMNGQAIEKPTYDYVKHTRSSITEHCEPCDVLILEGLFVLYSKEIRDLLDIKIFVDTDADIRFIRRLVRDVNERGRSLESVVNQYLNTVREMHGTFVEPSKSYADLIIPEGGSNTVAIDLLITKISSVIYPTML